MGRPSKSAVRASPKPRQRNQAARHAAVVRHAKAAAVSATPSADASGEPHTQPSWLLRVLRDDRVAFGLLIVPFLVGAFAIFWTGALHRPTRLALEQPAKNSVAKSSEQLDRQNLGALQTQPAAAEPVSIALLAAVELSPESRPEQPVDLVTAIDRELYELNGQERFCSLDEAAAAHALSLERVQSTAPQASTAFGVALAEAAEAQTRDFVVYTGNYKQIAFPMGDVSSMFGVCTDVIIRAYRSVGIDLQARVQKAHVGSGDPSIDHRRTETLRRFFAKYGTSLPITDFAEDYWPGDVVTYDRPQNQHTRSHIAIVSNRIARSGRPMIVHNRGWGPQIEDAVFVDRITGHYRYQGEAPEAKPASAAMPMSGAAVPAPGELRNSKHSPILQSTVKAVSARMQAPETKSTTSRRARRGSPGRRSANSASQ